MVQQNNEQTDWVYFKSLINNFIYYTYDIYFTNINNTEYGVMYLILL